MSKEPEVKDAFAVVEGRALAKRGESSDAAVFERVCVLFAAGLEGVEETENTASMRRAVVLVVVETEKGVMVQLLVDPWDACV